ncbi:MAG: hypothetical protein AAFX95_21125 [Cyanobacteria bacterium J06639_16]
MKAFWKLRYGVLSCTALILAGILGREFLFSQAVKLSTRGLPMREKIGLIEGATYRFGKQGTWFILSDGTVIPPLSYEAFVQGRAQFPTAIAPGMDEKFFWLLQGSPYVTAIAADLERGKLTEYVDGNTFNTDRFFVDYFIPIYVESSLAVGLDPGESLWMLDHALLTLQDPLLRTDDATPIIQGTGEVGSFWEREQALSTQQLALRRWIGHQGWTDHLVQYGLLTHLRYRRKDAPLDRRRLTSIPEVIAKLPNATYGAEEGAIAHALGIVQFQMPDIYAAEITQLAQQVVLNEQEKQRLRSQILEQLRTLSVAHTQELGDTLTNLSRADWDTFGLGYYLLPAEAAQLNGSNTISILVSRTEKAGFSPAATYPHARQLLLNLLKDSSNPAYDRVIFAILKDHAFTPSFWLHLANLAPGYAPEFQAIEQSVGEYKQIADQGADLLEQLYTAMINEGHDIGVSATLKHAVGFQAHLASLIDAAFLPPDPADPRYQAFRRTVAIYLREAPDISVYGGTQAALRRYGAEHLNVQELIAIDVASAPRLRAFARLYQESLAAGMITTWDVDGLQQILVFGALVAAGVEPANLPESIPAIAFPSQQFRQDLLFLVGPEGINVEGTRLGIQSHDYRVWFQPFDSPAQLTVQTAQTAGTSPSEGCPTDAKIDAIALHPAAQFQWQSDGPYANQVVLIQNERVCRLPAAWNALFFDTLLGYVAINHSPDGAVQLNQHLQEALMLEAGMF